MAAGFWAARYDLSVHFVPGQIEHSEGDLLALRHVNIQGGMRMRWIGRESCDQRDGIGFCLRELASRMGLAVPF